MKRLFIITFITLFFANSVKAEMINFNCNFKDGGQSEGGKDYPAKKMQALKITLDKDKKLIKDNKRQFDPYTEDKDTIHWTHNWPDNPMNIKIDEDDDEDMQLQDSSVEVFDAPVLVAKKAPAKKKASPAVKKERPEDPIWNAVMDVCGIDQTTLNQSERSKYGGCCKLLKESQATSEEIYVRSERYRKRYEGMVLTPPALVNHWSSLSQDDAMTKAVPAGWDAIKEARKQRGA